MLKLKPMKKYYSCMCKVIVKGSRHFWILNRVHIGKSKEIRKQFEQCLTSMFHFPLQANEPEPDEIVEGIV